MTTLTALKPISVEDRARQSAGTSSDAIYQMVARTVRAHDSGGVLIDVGCGIGNLWPYVSGQFRRYVGADVIQYEGFPECGEFIELNLDTGRVPLPDGTGDVVVAVETIEHLENPRAFVRELTRLAKPGGWVIVTTPNQLSLLSKLTLLLRNEFNAFRAGSYPAHITALLEVDLRRIVAECGLSDVAVDYTRCGRVVLTSRHYPLGLSTCFPRAMSDNVLIVGRKAPVDPDHPKAG